MPQANLTIKEKGVQTSPSEMCNAQTERGQSAGGEEGDAGKAENADPTEVCRLM